MHPFDLRDGKLSRAGAGDPTATNPKDDANKKKFRTGLALDSKRNRLYSLDMDAGLLLVIDLTGKELRS